jgi:hypothetical protein
MKPESTVASDRFWLALSARDWTAAKQIFDTNAKEDLIGDGRVKGLLNFVTPSLLGVRRSTFSGGSVA